MGTTKAERDRREKAERQAAWEAEEARVKALGDLFSALPEGHEKAALLDAMTDRIIQLYNEAKHEQGDAILEFLPNDYARELLDWYFDEDGPDTFTSKTTTADYEIVLAGQVQDQPQQSCRSDGQHSNVAHAEIVELAKDLVALWQSPKIQGLPRADRNTAIEETREKMIAVVSAVTNGE